MAAYISRTLLDKEYSEYKSNIKFMKIGDPDNISFGRYMNEKYNFKSTILHIMRFEDAYNFILEKHTKKA